MGVFLIVIVLDPELHMDQIAHECSQGKKDSDQDDPSANAESRRPGLILYYSCLFTYFLRHIRPGSFPVLSYTSSSE